MTKNVFFWNDTNWIMEKFCNPKSIKYFFLIIDTQTFYTFLNFLTTFESIVEK